MNGFQLASYPKTLTHLEKESGPQIAISSGDQKATFDGADTDAFLVAARSSNGHGNFIHLRNNTPSLFPDNTYITVDEDSVFYLGFSIMDDDDFFSYQLTSSDTSIIKPEKLVVLDSGTIVSNGRTLHKRALKVTPEADAFGQLSLNLTVSDGIGSQSRSWSILINPVNEYAPIAGKSDTLRNLTEDRQISLTLEEMSTLTGAVDPDGEVVQYFITKRNGTLRDNQRSFSDGHLWSPNSRITYTPPFNEHGIIEAFRLKATDGTFTDDTEMIVYVDVAPVNDPPRFTSYVAPSALSVNGGEHVVKVFGISPGPNEEGTVTVNALSSGAILNAKNMRVDYDSEQRKADIYFVTEPHTFGSGNLFVQLRDEGGLFYTESIPIAVLTPNEPPKVTTQPDEKAYVAEQYTYKPGYEDERDVSILTEGLPDWLKVEQIYTLGAVAHGSNNGTEEGRVEDVDIDGNIKDIAIDKEGNVYIASDSKDAIFKIDTRGEAKIILGGERARFNSSLQGDADRVKVERISGMVVDDNGNIIYLETDQYSIKKLTPEGQVSILAGGTQGTADGQGSNARFNWLNRIAWDNDSNLIVVDGNRIRKIDKDYKVTTIAGNGQTFKKDGPALEAQFRGITDLAVGPDGKIYITSNAEIRVLHEGVVSTFTICLFYPSPTPRE